MYIYTHIYQYVWLPSNDTKSITF